MSTSPLFFLAIAFSVTSLMLLALPLLAMAKDAVGPSSLRADEVVAAPGDVATPRPSSQLAVEQSVRGRLYGQRPNILIAPVHRPAGRRLDSRALPAGPPEAVERGRLIQGRYRLLQRAGAGGMASVYRARDELLKREVAVKLIAQRFADDQPFVECFRQEAQLCTRLTHPNIVAVLDAGDEPRDFFVMEFVDGLDGSRLLQWRGRLTPAETVHVVAQICEALAYAHEQGIVHCDVSLSNILLRRSDETAKLADFGLASGALDVLSLEGKAIGTPGHVAPEVLEGAKPTPRSDLYSLGVVTYRFLGGSAGFRPRDAGATAPLPSAAPRMPPLAEVRPDLPRDLIAVVERAIAHEPAARQESVVEFRTQLTDAGRARVQLQRDRTSTIRSEWPGGRFLAARPWHRVLEPGR